MSGPFTPRRAADIVDLVRAYPLAWVIGDGAAGFSATPLPLLPECDGDGRIVSLLGHFARANPQVAQLQAAPRALVLFQGPQGYVSPRLVSAPQWGPTWNYAVARFRVRMAFVPEENDHALQSLAETLEAGQAQPWTVARMGPRYAQLREHIIAFRAHVESVEATFKLGQDETRTSFEEIVAGHDNATLGEWMRRSRGD